MRRLHHMPISFEEADSFEANRMGFIRRCTLEDRFYKKLAEANHGQTAKIVAMAELALHRLEGILESTADLPERECPIGCWVRADERHVLQEYVARFPATTSEVAQAMRELAEVYDKQILDCGLPQEDEVAGALVHVLSALKHKVLV